MLDFEWDPAKAIVNIEKHKVAFDEAASAFGDPLSLTVPDPKHSEGEYRYLLLGMSGAGRLVVSGNYVAYCSRSPNTGRLSPTKKVGVRDEKDDTTTAAG